MRLCIRGLRRCGLVDERHGRQDLYSFGTRETSSGNIPTCCLWLGLIPYALGGSRLIVVAPLLDLSNLPGYVPSVLVVLGLSDRVLLWRLAPPYKGGGGRLTCRVLLGLG